MHARPVEAARDLLDGLLFTEVTARSGVVALVQNAGFQSEVVGDVEASGVFVVEVAAFDAEVQLSERSRRAAKKGDVGGVGAIGEVDVEEEGGDSVETIARSRRRKSGGRRTRSNFDKHWTL